MIWLLLLLDRETSNAQDIAPRVESHKRTGVGGSGPLILTAGDEYTLQLLTKDYRVLLTMGDIALKCILHSTPCHQFISVLLLANILLDKRQSFMQ